jgi:hypothetical protein
MKIKFLLTMTIALVQLSFQTIAGDNPGKLADRFDIKKDLLLLQLDCKTDVDDLHTLAAFMTLVANKEYSKLNFYPIAGTYGIQKGLYVPPNDLFNLAFGKNWSDADADFNQAIKETMIQVKAVLSKQGDIWIAEAGQSDFSAALVKAVQSEMPTIDVSQRIHVVQHSDWNEESTSPEALGFVKRTTDYHKIPDGNAVGNGSPGFQTSDQLDVEGMMSNKKLSKIWELAIDISNEYNGKDGRYNNKAVAAGGLDFSDLSEVCYILGLENIKDAEDFFEKFAD